MFLFSLLFEGCVNRAKNLGFSHSCHAVYKLFFARFSCNDFSEKIRRNALHYNAFKIFEDGLRKRYPSYPIMDKCLMLYSDPDFILKHTPASNESNIFTISSDAKILSALKIGPEKFLIKFNMCYDEIGKANCVLVVTDKEQVVEKDYRLHKEACPSFWIVAQAHDPLKTQFSWDYEHKSSPKMERKMF